MTEYIDIDAPIDVAVYQRNRRIQVTLRQILESTDAKYECSDVRPVVRCKDCAMANADSDERYMYCTKCHEYKPIDYYCAEGRHADA